MNREKIDTLLDALTTFCEGEDCGICPVFLLMTGSDRCKVLQSKDILEEAKEGDFN
jgi:hypothetical protein